MPTLPEPTAWGWGGAVFHSQGSGAGKERLVHRTGAAECPIHAYGGQTHQAPILGRPTHHWLISQCPLSLPVLVCKTGI